VLPPMFPGLVSLHCRASTGCVRPAASWRYPSTALHDLLAFEEDQRHAPVRCLDRILPHKTKLKGHLKDRYGPLFGAAFDVPLYDLTST
jgi:hypothetical protein